MSEEEIRGRDIRYWEDVQVGDETRPIVTGPTTIATNSLTSAIAPDIGFFMDNRPFFLASLGEELGPEFILDPATGRYVIRGGPAGRHWSDLAAQAEGEPCAWLFGVVSRFSLLRVLTNWMGDDGFLRRVQLAAHDPHPRGRHHGGAGRRSTGKRIEDGEHLVDLQVWLRNLRGNVSEAAVATVRLCSRETPEDWPRGGRVAATAAPRGDQPIARFKPGDRVRIKGTARMAHPAGLPLRRCRGNGGQVGGVRRGDGGLQRRRRVRPSGDRGRRGRGVRGQRPDVPGGRRGEALAAS